MVRATNDTNAVQTLNTKPSSTEVMEIHAVTVKVEVPQKTSSKLFPFPLPLSGIGMKIAQLHSESVIPDVANRESILGFCSASRGERKTKTLDPRLEMTGIPDQRRG